MFRNTVAALCACISTSAYGQAQCGDAYHVAKRLSEQYGESIVHAGYAAGRGIVETWDNSETGTFTIVLYNVRDDQRCIIVSGTDSMTAAPEPAGLRL